MNTHWLVLVHTFHSAWQPGYLDLKISLLNCFNIMHFSHSCIIIICNHEFSAKSQTWVGPNLFSPFLQLWSKLFSRHIARYCTCLKRSLRCTPAWSVELLLAAVCFIVITSTSWSTAFWNDGLLLSLFIKSFIALAKMSPLLLRSAQHWLAA